jgi:hypothetical protein
MYLSISHKKNRTISLYLSNRSTFDHNYYLTGGRVMVWAASHQSLTEEALVQPHGLCVQ